MSLRPSLSLILLLSSPMALSGVDAKKSNALLQKYLEKSLGKSSDDLAPKVECEDEVPRREPQVSYGSDPAYGASLKNYPRPSRGCIDPQSVSSSEIDALIDSQNFRTVGASSEERRTLALAIKRVQELNGGVLLKGKGEMSGGFPVYYSDENGSIMNYKILTYPSGKVHEPYEIRIGRKISRGKNHYGLSVAQFVHEWGHMIGQNGAYEDFAQFMNPSSYSKSDYCLVSNYADNSPGKQFSEVMAAFVTEPRILLTNTRTPDKCKRVFEFFKKWFKQGEKVYSCL